MHWLSLPEPNRKFEPAFADPESARGWLARQPQTLALFMLGALTQQIEAIDASEMLAEDAISLLNLMRSAAAPVQAGVEARFFRKPLPLTDDDQRCFEAAQQLWSSLGIAYLRRVPHLLPAARSLPLNRAACAFRMTAYCYFQAAQQYPEPLDHWLFGVLAYAAKHELLRQPLPDPDFPHFGDSHIGGHLAWAFLLRQIDPYRLTASELLVANRAISRWRELTTFQREPDETGKVPMLDLQHLSTTPLPDEVPRWLDVKTVTRKIRQRIDALRAGESTEALKLGRELSPAACTRLLAELGDSLQRPPQRPTGESGPIELFFGNENAFALFNGEPLNPPDLDTTSGSIAHERVAVFGFDQAERIQSAVNKVKLSGETWSMDDGLLHRIASRGQPRRQSPCLVALREEKAPRLGVLFGLQCTPGHELIGGLHCYDEDIEAGWLKRPGPLNQKMPRIAAFLLEGHGHLSLILPVNAGARLNFGLALEGTSVTHLVPYEVLERGIDFVRYACKRT
nr:hypothetical protein [Dechloromonas sp.]